MIDRTQRPLNTIAFPIARTDLIMTALESFWRVSDREEHRVIVIDQTSGGLPDLVNLELAHVHFRCYRNLGFAKAANTAIRLADTPLVTICNDDVEFFDDHWWPEIVTLMTRDEFVGAAPFCPKLPGWSIGKDHDEFIGGIDSREKCYDPNVYQTLLRECPFRGYVNGPAFWCITFKKAQLLSEIGYFDERFYPGGGEDYDMLGRAAKAGLKIMGTWKSWVWHDWGQTKDIKAHDGMIKVGERPSWNRLGDLWPDGFDAWGRKGDRILEVYVEQL